MSYGLPKINLLSSNELPSHFQIAKSHSPTGDDLYMIGNTIISPAKRNASPASGNYPSLEISPSRNSPGNNLFKPGIDEIPVSHQDLLVQQTYNTLGSRLGLKRGGSRGKVSSSPPLLSPITLADRDYVPDIINPGGLNQGFPNAGFQPYYMQPSYSKDPRNRLDSVQENPNIGSVVNTYLDKQNQLMARILKDVEDFKRMELLKQRAQLEQQFARVEDPLGGMLSPFQGMPMPMAVPVQPQMIMPIPMQMSLPMQMQMQQMQQLQQMQQMPMSMAMPQQVRSQSQLQTPLLDQGRLKKQTPTIALRAEPNEESPAFNKKSSLPPVDKSKGSPKKEDKAGDLMQEGRSIKKKGANKKANKARGRKNLRAIGWSMALPGLWFISVVKWAEKRREAQLKALEDNIPEHLEKFLEFAAGVLDKEIKALVTDKNSMVLVHPPGTNVKPAEIGKRCKSITDHLVTILDSLSLKMDSGKLPKEFFQFLANLSEDDAILPDNFLSGFEIDRLSFNMFGNLRFMNEWRSKMILGAFILIKGLLYFLIMRSWTVISTIPEKNVNMKNIINVGSALYHVVLDIFTENVAEAGDKETEPPFKAAPPTFAAIDPTVLNKLDVIPDDNDDDEQEIVSGFYNRDRLITYLDDRPSMIKEVKEAVLDFLDVIYELTHSVYEPKAHVKKMFGDHRPKNK